MLWLWLRLRDLPIRVLEFIDMVVPHRFVKGYWEPSMKLAGHVVDGNFRRLLASLAVVLDLKPVCILPGIMVLREALDVCMFH